MHHCREEKTVDHNDDVLIALGTVIMWSLTGLDAMLLASDVFYCGGH